MKKRTFALSAVVMLVLAALIPLSNSHAQSSSSTNVTSTARFRVVIAAPLSTAVDVYLDGGITTISGLAAAKPLNASGYVNTVGGGHTITLDQTGTTTPVSTFNTTFTAGTNSSLVLLPNMTWMVLLDLNPAPAPLSANVRLVNLSPNNNPVSLSVNGVVPAAFTSIAYQASSASYVSYPVGVADTLAIPGSTAKVISYTFQDGHVYSIFVFFDPVKNLPKIVAKSDTTYIKATPIPTVGFGTPVPTPTIATPVPTVGATPTPSPSLTNASIRLVNANPSNPLGVDVWVDGALSKTTNVPYGSISSYRPVTGSAAPGTSHVISVVATGTSAPVLASVTTNFISLASETLVFAQGSANLLIFKDSNGLPATGFTSVRFVNLSPDAGSLNLEIDASTIPAFSGISSNKGSSYANVALVPHILWVVPAGSTSPLLIQMEKFQARRVYTIFVFGQMNAVPSTLQAVVKVDYSDPILIDLPLVMR